MQAHITWYPLARNRGPSESTTYSHGYPKRPKTGGRQLYGRFAALKLLTSPTSSHHHQLGGTITNICDDILGPTVSESAEFLHRTLKRLHVIGKERWVVGTHGCCAPGLPWTRDSKAVVRGDCQEGAKMDHSIYLTF